MSPRHDAATAPWRRYIAALRARLGQVELTTLLLALLLLGGLFTFAAVAEEVAEGETRRLDEAVLLGLRNPADPADPLGPRWLEEVGRDFTAFGSMAVLAFVTLAAIGYLLLRRKERAALLVFAAVAGGFLLSTLLKAGFDRPRPDLVPHGASVYTASFPSGHAMLSALTYLTLGALLARIHAGRAMKAYCLGLALLLTFVVGLSRIYMGVHWPTDVLAGWAAGAAWALACWLAALWLQQRGAVEASVDAPEVGAPPAGGDPAPNTG